MRLRVGGSTPACARDGLTGCRCRDRRKQLGHLVDEAVLRRRALDEAVRARRLPDDGRLSHARAAGGDGDAADQFSNPDDPAARILARYLPIERASVGGWLERRVRAGRIRDIPALLLVQQLIGPLLAHVLLRSAMTREAHWDESELERTCSVFASASIRAVALPARYRDTTSDCMPDHPLNDAKAG